VKFVKACIIICILLTPIAANAADNLVGAKIFWRTFRQAVLGGNTAEIASMTRFPFEVRGVDDSDPVKRYNQQKFPAIFRQVISQQVVVMTGQEVIEKTMLQVVSEKKDLSAVDMATPDFFTVELFNFHLIKGRWLFTRAYLEQS
jgi:hydroxyethylthiazole kinase-like sugar kinase family protein